MKIIKVPWDCGSMNKNPGAKKAPDTIVNELENVFLTEAGKQVTNDIDEVNVNDSNFEETNKAIYDKVREEAEKYHKSLNTLLLEALAKGAAANILTPHVGDANTTIPEYKAFLVDVV